MVELFFSEMDSFVWCFHFGIFPSPQHPCLNARIDPILLHAHDTLANGDNAGLHSPNDLTDTYHDDPAESPVAWRQYTEKISAT
jgi:hypothetical protein